MNEIESMLYEAHAKARQLWGDPCGVGLAFDCDKEQWAALAAFATDPHSYTKPSLLVYENTPTLAVTELLKQLNEWRPQT